MPANKPPKATQPQENPGATGNLVIMDAAESQQATAHAQQVAAARYAPGNYIPGQGAQAALAQLAHNAASNPPAPPRQTRPGLQLAGPLSPDEVEAAIASATGNQTVTPQIGGSGVSLGGQHTPVDRPLNMTYAVLSYARGGRTRVSKMVGSARAGSWLTDDPVPTLEILGAFGIAVTDLRDDEEE